MSLMVSVSGIRGLIGKTLTPTVVAEFAQAYATLIGGGRVVAARDSRPSGEMFQSAAIAGLLAAGCEITNLGVVMTPTVGHAILRGGFAGGVSITASHNPREWNGMKFLDARGLAPDVALASQIAGVRERSAYRFVDSGFRAVQIDRDAGRRHVADVLANLEVDLTPIRGMRIVVDSVNGAGGPDAATLLAALGCELAPLNAEPTGEFAHPPEPTAENLTQLCDAVRAAHAAVGFAQDPDADRLAIVDERGAYIGEEYTLALAVWSTLTRRRGTVAANLSTSRLIDVVASRHGCEVIRTAVGEANVARAMSDRGCVVGGEGNGGVIDPRICWVRDSLSAMSLVLQLMASTGKRLSELVAQLPPLAMVKQKLECPRDRIDRAVDAVAAAFHDEKLNRADGTRVDFADGWVHLRASNTEPIVRIIAEAGDLPAAESLIARVRSAAGI